ncbi:MAG: ATP-binding cassette domain-containing protein, partial [Candidatus Nanopelagicaceae bacterium]
MKTLLEIEGVSKSFGSVIANENISLTVKEGEILALLGENGAGKSTLVKAV